MAKLHIDRAVVVEGRDDVRAVSSACDALIIPTHGYGISKETWQELEKADSEKGLVILTDPDHAGREIRKRLEDRFPGAIHAYLGRDDATDGSDIGIENAKPDIIREALIKALSLSERSEESHSSSSIDIKDLTMLGLAGAEGSSEKRARICKALGIGYGNASALIKKLNGFGISIDELKEALKEIE